LQGHPEFTLFYSSSCTSNQLFVCPLIFVVVVVVVVVDDDIDGDDDDDDDDDMVSLTVAHILTVILSHIFSNHRA